MSTKKSDRGRGVHSRSRHHRSRHPGPRARRGGLLAHAGGFGLAGAAALGCAPEPATRVPSLCAFTELSAEERAARRLPASTWLTLISPTVDRDAATRSGRVQSACGQPLPSLEETFRCPGVDVDVERVDDDVVEESDLVMTGAGKGRTLLWAATDELVSGETEGAAALALWTPEGGLEIHAVGLLRSYREGARLALHNMGATPVVIINSDRCDAEGRCVPIAHVVPIVRRQLVELPLWSPEGACLGRAQFELERREEQDLGDGVSRRFILTRSLELKKEGVFVTDLLRMEDFRPAAPTLPPVPFRKINARRPLVLQADRFVLEGKDLWTRALRDHGSVGGTQL